MVPHPKLWNVRARRREPKRCRLAVRWHWLNASQKRIDGRMRARIQVSRFPLLGLSLYPHPTHGSGNLSHPYWSCQGPAHREFYLRDVERMGHSLDTGLRDRFSGLWDSPWAASSVAWRDGSRSSALGATWLLGRPGTFHPEAKRGPRLSQSEGARAVPL